MTATASAKPATGATVNGLQEVDRLGRQIDFTASSSFQPTRAFDYGLLNFETAELLRQTANRIRKAALGHASGPLGAALDAIAADEGER
jgi:hypothetical protein